MNLIGVSLQLAYRLRRHLWLGWSLARWFGLLLLAAGLVALIRTWSRPWPAIVLAGVFLTYALVLAWAARRRYVYFETAREAEAWFQELPAAPPLRAEEMVPVRASGWFSVEGKSQYYMDVEADFETVATREHIVLGRVHDSRFLLLGRWPAWELGWWYIFFQPHMIQQLDIGHLHFGPSAHQALRVTHASDEKTVQTIYLAFDEIAALRRVWDDLCHDAPAARKS